MGEGQPAGQPQPAQPPTPQQKQAAKALAKATQDFAEAQRATGEGAKRSRDNPKSSIRSCAKLWN